ncbi:MAG: DsbA family protein [Proteobacteria bacterium]|nr:DsbA family protein [Pseudomonadota bacterium]
MTYFSSYSWWIAAIGMMLMLAGAPAASAQEFDDAQKAEIETIIGEYLKKNPEFIRDYLVENPEILLEVSDKLRAQQIQQERESATLAMTAHKEKLERHPITPVTGNPEGDITLIEFFDYNCSFCKRAFTYMREIEKDDPNLRVAWKEYPILAGRTPTSLTAAKVAMAADLQGKYIEVHTALMDRRGSLASDAQVLKIAEGVGLDMDKLKKDMESSVVRAYISETVQLGEALQFQGTPTFVINGAVIGGAVPKEYILAVIAAARAGALKPGELTEQDLGQIVQQFGS